LLSQSGYRQLRTRAVPVQEHRGTTESSKAVDSCRLALAGVGIFHSVQFIHRQGRANAALFDSIACGGESGRRFIRRSQALNVLSE
jgi:hypothetical protein